MNADSVNYVQRNLNLKHLEIAAYAVLAICLIGHVFYLESQLSAINVALLTGGIIFGMMATVAWTPIAERFSVPGAFNLAEVLSFSRGSKPDADPDMNDRRAA